MAARNNNQGRGATAWMFTLNNPDNYANPLRELEESVNTPHVDFVACQLERGQNGTLHIQGYIIFPQRKRLATIRRMSIRMGPLWAAAHWEPREGTHQQALEYVTKEDTRVAGPYQWGVEPMQQQGHRTDLDIIHDLLRSGVPMRQIAEEYFTTWCRNYRAFQEYRNLVNNQPRDFQTNVVVYWGEASGTGKTRSALNLANELCHDNPGWSPYWMPKPNQDSVYFNGYDGQEVVILDEFYGWIPRDLMQRMCDRYPLLVNTKGGMVNFRPHYIIITSNQNPERWWQRLGLGEPMRRRLSPPIALIHHVVERIHFPEDDERPLSPFMGAEHAGTPEDEQVLLSPMADIIPFPRQFDGPLEPQEVAYNFDEYLERERERTDFQEEPAVSIDLTVEYPVAGTPDFPIVLD